jgi:hypothetical protein
MINVYLSKTTGLFSRVVALFSILSNYTGAFQLLHALAYAFYSPTV